MDGILLSEDVQGFVEFALFYAAMAGEVATLCIRCDEVPAREERQGASVVAVGKVELGEPKDIFGVV
jgi:hypothetical protein